MGPESSVHFTGDVPEALRGRRRWPGSLWSRGQNPGLRRWLEKQPALESPESRPQASVLARGRAASLEPAALPLELGQPRRCEMEPRSTPEV